VNFVLDKLQAIEDKCSELENMISDPSVMADMAEWQKYTKAHAKMLPVVTKFREYKAVRAALSDTQEMLSDQLDAELKEMAPNLENLYLHVLTTYFTE
jgi:peptide chain release factor 1